MSATHLHLILTHVPILGVIAGTVLLAVAAARRHQDYMRLALALFVVSGLAVVPVFRTGEPAEEAVEHLAGVSETVIHRHEDAAKTSLVLTEVLAAGALGLLILFRRRPVPASAAVALLGLALAASLSLGYTGSLGGQIRHSEIRGEALLVPVGAEVGGEEDED